MVIRTNSSDSLTSGENYDAVITKALNRMQIDASRHVRAEDSQDVQLSTQHLVAQMKLDLSHARDERFIQELEDFS